MTDYSQHLTETQHLIRTLYEHCQNLEYMKAMEICTLAITELKLAYNSIHDLADKQNPDMVIGVWRDHGS